MVAVFAGQNLAGKLSKLIRRKLFTLVVSVLDSPTVTSMQRASSDVSRLTMFRIAMETFATLVCSL